MSQFSIHDSRQFADAADSYAATLDIAIARDGLKRAFAEGVAHALRLSVGDIRTGDDETLAAIAKLYTKTQNPQTQRDVEALRQALATIRRAVQGTSNDSEMDSVREALELALVRVPRSDAATIHDEIDALAEQDSNDGEIDGLHAALKGVLRYWPEIDLAAS